MEWHIQVWKAALLTAFVWQEVTSLTKLNKNNNKICRREQKKVNFCDQRRDKEQGGAGEKIDSALRAAASKNRELHFTDH